MIDNGKADLLIQNMGDMFTLNVGQCMIVLVGKGAKAVDFQALAQHLTRNGVVPALCLDFAGSQ